MVKTSHYFVIEFKTKIFFIWFCTDTLFISRNALHALCANRFIATGMSDDVERGRECKVAGRGCGRGRLQAWVDGRRRFVGERRLEGEDTLSN